MDNFIRMLILHITIFTYLLSDKILSDHSISFTDQVVDDLCSRVHYPHMFCQNAPLSKFEVTNVALKLLDL